MNLDVALRAAAVVAAAAIVVAPKWAAIASAAIRLAQAIRDAAKSHGKAIGRCAAAGLLVAAAWGKVPMPSFGDCTPRVEVETPDDSMRELVKPIADAIKDMPPGDRMLWASVWNKAALVVDAPDGPEALFSDTASLRLFTVLSLDIAWRRIGGHVPGGNEPLRKAVEAAYVDAVGPDGVSVSRDVRGRYAAFARAVAWAGVHGG